MRTTIQDIYKRIDKHIVGQESTKKELAKAFFVHKYQTAKELSTWVDISRRDYIYPHLLMTGPTGCGKTEMVTSLCEEYNWPLITVDMSVVTPSGYVGVSLAEVLCKEAARLQDEKFSTELIQRSVIFIDEFDKIVPMGESDKTVRDFKNSVQYELLKFMETGVTNGDSRNNREYDAYFQHSMVILAGNFPELRKDEIVKGIGFGSKLNTNLTNEKTMRAKLKASGLSTQLMGRVNFISHLERLTKDQLSKIVRSPNIMNGSLHDFLDVMGEEVDEQAIEQSVNEAFEDNTGARGLRKYILMNVLDKVADRGIGILDESVNDEIDSIEDKLAGLRHKLHQLENNEMVTFMAKESLVKALPSMKNGSPELATYAAMINEHTESLKDIQSTKRAITSEIKEQEKQLKKIKRSVVSTDLLG